MNRITMGKNIHYQTNIIKRFLIGKGRMMDRNKGEENVKSYRETINLGRTLC